MLDFLFFFAFIGTDLAWSRTFYKGKIEMNKLLTLTALGTILAAAQVQAAGYHLREQSAAAQGNAYAGATAGAENLSYAYFNAAGITRQKGININFGGTYIAPKAEAKNIYNHTTFNLYKKTLWKKTTILSQKKAQKNNENDD